MKTADQILKDHEDANEMHFHQVDREWIIKAMEEYAKTTRPWIKCEDQLPEPPTAAKPLLAAAVPCSHEDIYLRKSGIWKCKQCGKVFY